MKRIFCLVFSLLIIMMSAFCFGASAEELTSTDCIYFQVPTATNIAWKNFSLVFCHIWEEGDEGGDFYPWQAKDERCTDLGNGYWSYDITQFEFKEDSKYSVIFSNENGMQTYNLSLTSACKGDIVYCDGDTCVNPVDSEKQCTVARWMENKDSVHPCAQVSSDGTMVDPDGIFNTDIDLKWGSAEGVSITMPEVKVVEETQVETEGMADETDSTEDASTLPTMWIVIGAVALVAAIIAVVLVVVKRKK
ncbi:MAG: starch-binding protein [Ruminococcaceae bacterium]|nr:starch-binding protein [Oscillospiraceae bacterium]